MIKWYRDDGSVFAEAKSNEDGRIVSFTQFPGESFRGTVNEP